MRKPQDGEGGVPRRVHHGKERIPSLGLRGPQEAFSQNKLHLHQCRHLLDLFLYRSFRLERDVLSKRPINLLFVEFVINDDQDGHFTREACIRGMEGIIGHARMRNPDTDIVVIFFVNVGMIRAIRGGKTPLSIAAGLLVAEYYGIPMVNVASELTDEIAARAMTWKEYGGVHPAAPGNELCTMMIDELFRQAWLEPLSPNATPIPHQLFDQPLHPMSYTSGHFVDPRRAMIKSGWAYGVPNWGRKPKAKLRPRLKGVPMLCGTEPGAEAVIDFEGTAVGAYVVSGPDSGIVDVRIDGGPFRPVNLAFGPCARLHYPSTVMFGSGLSSGKHTLTLRMSSKASKPGKTGHAMRIVQFAVN